MKVYILCSYYHACSPFFTPLHVRSHKKNHIVEVWPYISQDHGVLQNNPMIIHTVSVSLYFLAATKQLYEWYCLSVCPSVTPLWLCSHKAIIMKFSGVITKDRGKVHAKDQGQRSKVKVTNCVQTNTHVEVNKSAMYFHKASMCFLSSIKLKEKKNSVVITEQFVCAWHFSLDHRLFDWLWRKFRHMVVQNKMHGYLGWCSLKQDVRLLNMK